MEVAGINRLLEGYLPREFVPPSTVQSVLLRIKDELSRFGSGFQLAYTDVQHYYHIQDIAFCVKNEQLFIMLKIPISRIAARMDIYRLFFSFTGNFIHIHIFSLVVYLLYYQFCDSHKLTFF
jgi:hypothetical protein